MLLKKLILTNFRQYKGVQTIRFSCDKEKKVTVVLGKNTSGKTTLVQAFNWCLYGEKVFKTTSLLNKEVEEDLAPNSEAIVSAVLEFEHKGRVYTVKRSETYRRVPNGDVRFINDNSSVSYLGDDGQTKTLGSTYSKEIINEVLPHELSSYFFFDGERINSISTKGDLANAVKGLIGLNSFENAIDHLKRTKKLFEAGLEFGADANIVKYKNKIDVIENDLLNIESSMSSIESEIEYYTDQLEVVRQELKDNAKTAELQKKVEQLEHVIAGCRADYLNAVEELRVKFNSNPFGYFGKELINQSSSTIDQYQSDTVLTFKGVVDETIYQILQAGICLCGTHIKQGSVEEACLRKQLNYVPPKNISSMLTEFNTNSKNHLSYAEDYRASIIKQYEIVRKKKRQIREYQDDLDDLNKQMTSPDKSPELKFREKTYLQTIQDKSKEKENLILKKGAYIKELSDLKKNIDDVAQANVKNEKIYEYIAYVDELSKRFSDDYNKKELEARSKLEKKVQANFRAMYHGKRNIQIDPYYRVKYSDIITDESAGLETVKNFAFIAGLADIAREKMDSTEADGVALLESYPLVMDAPFSTADGIHITNISKILPTVADQLIMVIMEKDWTFAKTVLEDQVGAKVVLNKISETETRFVPNSNEGVN